MIHSKSVIGSVREVKGSLVEHGIKYKRGFSLLSEWNYRFDGIKNTVTPSTKLVEIQRSKGL